MGLDPAAHVPLHVARSIARDIPVGAFRQATREASGASGASGGRGPEGPSAAAPASRSNESSGASPHSPIRSSSSSGSNDPDRWDEMLNRLGKKHNVPPLFLKAVMIGESGGDPNAIGDDGHSVGLFQLHDQGYGHGMGDARFDPETNAERAVKGLAEAWHAGERAGYEGEYAVRAAYDYSFNPGGGFAYQGDAIVGHYNDLLQEQGRPPLS